MKTYVINTSLNKTLDSNKLFALTGYHKIRYMNHTLDEMDLCLETILTNQNTLGFEPFRIVVVVDFFGFDRIRSPYGRSVGGYIEEPGKVETGVYYPFIEAYLADKLFDKLEKKDIHVSECVVCYIVSGEYKRYSQLDTEREQIKKILSGEGEETTYCEEHIVPVLSEDDPLYEEMRQKYAALYGDNYTTELIPENGEDPKWMKLLVKTKGYKKFSLYCSTLIQLSFNLSDYPYGFESDERAASLNTFLDAFLKRSGEKNTIRHYYYLSENGSGEIAKASDTLSLSLYLIQLFEREDSLGDEKIVIPPIDPMALKDLLEDSYNKVCAAEASAERNPSLYYSLKRFENPLYPVPDEETLQEMELEKEVQKQKKKYKSLPKSDRMPPENQIREVIKHYNHTVEKGSEEYRDKFNDIFDRYLQNRDCLSDESISDAMERIKNRTEAEMTDQCPSKEEYDAVVEVQKKNISDRFSRTLGYDLFDVDYTEEKETASRAYIRYFRHSILLKPALLADVICLIVSVLTCVVPYFLYQLRYLSHLTYTIFLLCAASFAAVFLLGVFWLTIPTAVRLAKEKKTIQEQYLRCLAKYEYAFYQLNQRYEKDLIYVEELRYTIREIGELYRLNNLQNEYVRQHRLSLEEVHDELARLITNLGDVPTIRKSEDISGDFDITQPITAPQNKIYKIFSIDAIEKLLTARKDSFT